MGDNADRGIWQLPAASTVELRPRSSQFCVMIPTINEGDRIRRELAQLREFAFGLDVVVADGGSTDGSLELGYLESKGVRALLTKVGPGRLAAQLRMGFAYALDQGYEGVITVDGNEKDGLEAIPRFVAALSGGFDFVQGSRFIEGGEAVDTPRLRLLAIRLIHAPVVSSLAGFHYTDTTNGFRGHSRRLLLDPRVSLFRDVFTDYELLAYLSVKAPRLGFRITEVPVRRTYPATGKIPTKLTPVRGHYHLLRVLWNLALRRYDP